MAVDIELQTPLNRSSSSLQKALYRSTINAYSIL